MTTYYINEAAFELPDIELLDRSTTYLEEKGAGDERFALIVNRGPVPVGKSLREIVASYLARAARSQLAYTVLDQRDIEVAGLPAIEVEARWREDGEMIFTHQAHVASGSTWLLIGGRSRLEDRERTSAHVTHVLRTLRLRE